MRPVKKIKLNEYELQNEFLKNIMAKKEVESSMKIFTKKILIFTFRFK